MTEPEPDLFRHNSIALRVHKDDLAAADEARRAVDRSRRRQSRLAQLRRWQGGTSTVGSFGTAATRAAIERGVRVDSDEWSDLLEAEVRRVVQQIQARRRYATVVLERYNHFLQATRARREEAARLERAEVRRTAEVRTLTVPLLCDRLGITEAFAQHLVQPYCGCEREAYENGWILCGHARDEGVTP